MRIRESITHCTTNPFLSHFSPSRVTWLQTKMETRERERSHHHDAPPAPRHKPQTSPSSPWKKQVKRTSTVVRSKPSWDRTTTASSRLHHGTIARTRLSATPQEVTHCDKESTCLHHARKKQVRNPWNPKAPYMVVRCRKQPGQERIKLVWEKRLGI